MAIAGFSSNDPTVRASGVQVAVTLPSGLTFDAATSPANCTGAGNVVTCSFGRLRDAQPGVSVFHVTAVGAGVKTLSSTITGTLSSGVDVDPTNDTMLSTPLVVTALPRADAAMSFTGSTLAGAASGATANEGTWRFQARSNYGNATAAVARITIPVGATVRYAHADGTPCGTPVANVLTCDLGDLSGCGCGRSITVVLALPGAGRWDVAAEVTTSAGDDEPSNDRAVGSVLLRDRARADYRVTLTAPETAVVGDAFQVVAEVTNAGPAASTGTITLDLPDNAVVRRVTRTPADQGSCTTLGTDVTCTVAARLRVYATVDTSVLGTATSSVEVVGTTTEIDPDDNDAEVATEVLGDGKADVAVKLTANAASVVQDGGLVYRMSVTSRGPSDAGDVTATLDLPPGATSPWINAMSSSITSCVVVSGDVVCSWSGLDAGYSGYVNVSVLTATPGPLAATATVTSATDDPTAGNDVSPLTVSVTAPPSRDTDLGVSMSDPPDAVLGSGSLTHETTITNDGANLATGVVLTDALPTSSTFVSATSTRGGCGAPVSGVLTCNVGGLVPGGTVTVRVTTTPTAAGVFTNAATVTSDGTDPVPANDTVSQSTTVSVPRADLAMSVAPSATTVTVGDSVTFTGTVRNNGPQAATAANVAAMLDPKLAIVSSAVVAPTGACGVPSGQSVSCPVATIASGASAVVTVTATATAAGTTGSSFTASSSTVDGATGNDTATAAVTIEAASLPPGDPTPPTPTPDPTPPTSTPPSTTDRTSPTVAIKGVKCTGKKPARVCTISGTAADAGGIAKVELSVYRKLTGKKCLSWSGTAWRTVTCAKAQTTWIVVGKRAGTWTRKLPRVAAGALIIRARSTDTARNVSKIASRNAKA